MAYQHPRYWSDAHEFPRFLPSSELCSGIFFTLMNSERDQPIPKPITCGGRSSLLSGRMTDFPKGKLNPKTNILLPPLLDISADGSKPLFMGDDEPDGKFSPCFRGRAITNPNCNNTNTDYKPPLIDFSGTATAPDVTAVPAPPKKAVTNTLNNVLT